MGIFSEHQQRMMDQATGQELDRRLELSRRIGLAVGQIQEAMGLLENTDKSDARYWAYKALVRAKAMLETGDIAL